MSFLRTLTLAAAIPLMPAVAGAAEPGWYLGAAYLQLSTAIEDVAQGFEAHTIRNDNGFKLIAGYQALEWLAIEANYADLGKSRGILDIVCIPEDPCGGEFDFETRTLSLAAIASVSAGPVDFFARAGLARWDTDLTFGIPGASSIDGTDPVYGAGIRVNIRAVALRLEYEHQDFDGNIMNQVSLGAIYTFGR